MIKVYTQDNCRYCDMAKQLLNSKAIPFEQVRVGVDINREVLKEQFVEARTMPVITIGGVYIGGFDQLKIYLSEGTEGPQLLNE